ncbi:MAG: hypothetical protein R3A46_09190 [Thermomicrobiales bacterium]
MSTSRRRKATGGRRDPPARCLTHKVDQIRHPPGIDMPVVDEDSRDFMPLDEMPPDLLVRLNRVAELLYCMAERIVSDVMEESGR